MGIIEQAGLSNWTLVFDLDGTLVETAPDLHAALNHTLASKGLGPVPLAAIRNMIGDGAKAMIRKGLSWHDRPIEEAEIDENLWPIFIDHYLENICRLSAPYPGALRALEELKTKGAILSVCTNKAQHLAEEVLAGLKMDHLFSSVLGGDKASNKKPDAVHIIETVTLAGGNSSRAIMIGDAHTDEGAARACGLPLIFVTFGYGKLSDRPYEHLRSIDTWDEMIPSVLDLIQTV